VRSSNHHWRHLAACARVAATARRQVVARASASTDRLQRVLSDIDSINSQDPRKTTWQGEELPYELA
jgi:hypothetical protein